MITHVCTPVLCAGMGVEGEDRRLSRKLIGQLAWWELQRADTEADF